MLTDDKNTFEWQLRRLLILKRDGFKCTKCGSTHILQIHHLKYDNKLKYWEYPDEYLITLCDLCHKKEHNNTPLGDFYILNKRIKKYKFPIKLLKAFDNQSIK